MTDEDIEKIIKRNMNLQMNLAGIRADFEEGLQRTWVGLSDEETETLIHRFDGDPHTLLDEVSARLKEKNHG